MITPPEEALTERRLRSLASDPRHPVHPLFSVRSRPHEDEVLDGARQRRILLHEKDPRRVPMRFKKVRKVAGHGLDVRGDQNSIRRGSQSKNIRILNSLQLGFIRRLKVHRRLATPTTAHDAIVKTCVRQIANHPLASPRKHLLPHALKLFFDFRRIRVHSREFIFELPAFNQVLFGLFFIAQIERDGAVNLFKAESGVMSSDRLGCLSIHELINDEGERHTAPDEVEAPLPSFNKFFHTFVFSLSKFALDARGSLAFLVPPRLGGLHGSRMGWRVGSL